MSRKRRKGRRRNPKLKHILPFVLLAGGAVVVYLLIKKSDTSNTVRIANAPALDFKTPFKQITITG